MTSYFYFEMFTNSLPNIQKKKKKKKPIYLEHNSFSFHLLDLIYHFLTHNVNYKKNLFSSPFFLQLAWLFLHMLISAALDTYFN